MSKIEFAKRLAQNANLQRTIMQYWILTDVIGQIRPPLDELTEQIAKLINATVLLIEQIDITTEDFREMSRMSRSLTKDTEASVPQLKQTSIAIEPATHSQPPT